MIEYKQPLINKISLIIFKRNGYVTNKEINTLRKCSIEVLKEVLKEIEVLK